MTGPPRQRTRMGLPVRDQRRASSSNGQKSALFQQMQTERTILDNKIAKLRKLRLAKEEADREVARLSGENKKQEQSGAK